MVNRHSQGWALGPGPEGQTATRKGPDAPLRDPPFFGKPCLPLPQRQLHYACHVRVDRQVTQSIAISYVPQGVLHSLGSDVLQRRTAAQRGQRDSPTRRIVRP